MMSDVMEIEAKADRLVELTSKVTHQQEGADARFGI